MSIWKKRPKIGWCKILCPRFKEIKRDKVEDTNLYGSPKSCNLNIFNEVINYLDDEFKKQEENVRKKFTEYNEVLEAYFEIF